MTQTITGYFDEKVYEFIEYKRALGYRYKYEEEILFPFAKKCQVDFPDAKEITQDMAFCLSERRENESEWTRGKRIGVMREFAKYLNSIGEKAYVLPTGLVREPPKYIPHIYSKEELTLLFRNIDARKFCGNYPLNHLTMPVIFRLIYCCGLRPTEARMLQTDDVDLEAGELKILESKGHKDRLVVMSDDMTALCQKYDAHAQIVYPGRKHFFHSPDYRSGQYDGMFSTAGLSQGFKRFLKDSRLPETPGNPPRLYDLRHTFATHRLYEWIAQGKNVDALLPVLSAYMGHEHLSHTAYYLHIAKDIYTSMNEWSNMVYAQILPEVEYED